MLARSVRHLPAFLVPLAAAWVLGSRGVDPAPWVSALTVAGLTLLWLACAGRRLAISAAQRWLGALLAWAAVVALLRPVAVFDAARCLAMGVVALVLTVVAGTPRGGYWGRAAVVGGGTLAALWLLGGRVALTGRPAGPFDNPNLAATLALLALALAPFLPMPRWASGALMAVLTAGIIASASRAALVGSLAVAIAWALAGSGARWWRLGVAALVLITGLGLALRLLNDRDPLRFERLRIWGVAWRTIVAELPLGCGPGGYEDAALPHNFPRSTDFARFARLPTLAESDFLQCAATLGVPGAALMIGLAASVVRRLAWRDARGWGVAAALTVTSSVHTQIAVPAVAWTAALAVAVVLPRTRRGAPMPRSLAAAIALLVAVPTAAVLALPDWGLGEAPDVLAERAMTATPMGRRDDATLADAEALLTRACTERPRFGAAWRGLGAVALQRATLRGESDLAAGAAAAFAEARRRNPFDALAALGESQALRLLGDREAALRALAVAAKLEPNFVQAWLEVAIVRLEGGEVGAARTALRHAEEARQRAQGVVFVSGYENTLAGASPGTLERLRDALGGPR